MGVGCGDKVIGLSVFWEFEPSLGWGFKLSLGLQIDHRVMRKIVLYIVCFAYSLL